MSVREIVEFLYENYKVEKEFVINPYLKLRLIGSKTIIFVDNKPFNHCKYLLLNLSKKDFKNFDKIDSIDEAFQIYNEMDKSNETEKHIIDPKTEFIGHCSNLQVWHEYDYDVRILHSNLSIPLLKKLASVGDKRALIRFKEEIASRIANSSSKSLFFYFNENYLDFFSNEEIETIFELWLENKKNNKTVENRKVWLPLLREMTVRGIKKAKILLKEEIQKGFTDERLKKFRFFLTSSFLEVFDLQELEEISESIPTKDESILRPLHNLILKKVLERRRRRVDKYI